VIANLRADQMCILKHGPDFLAARSLKSSAMRMTCRLQDLAMSDRFLVTASQLRMPPSRSGLASRMTRSREFRMRIFLLTNLVTWSPLLVDANQVMVDQRILPTIGLASLEA
jgi:hypothetical protein